MFRPFLIGDKLYLRALEESDITEEYVGWLNDPDVTRFLETGRYPASLESIRSYFERFRGSTTNTLFAIVDRDTETHIGNVTLNNIHWVHRYADTGIMIGRKDFHGLGYGIEAWRLVIQYAFERLGLRKIIAGALAGNKTSIAVLTKLGFQQEGTFRSQYLVEGAFMDSFRFGLFREEFRHRNEAK